MKFQPYLLWLAGMSGPVLQGCASAASAPEPAVASASPSEALDLLIQGYNYTDHYIDSFTVNGQGGGNVFTSSPTSGGGKSTCCYTLYPGGKPMLTVRWTASYCSYTTTNRYGETYRWRRGLWREVQVPIAEIVGPVKALEVHFYPDGHVEAAATPGYSPPRLKLPATANHERPGVSNDIPVCPDEPVKP